MSEVLVGVAEETGKALGSFIIIVDPLFRKNATTELPGSEFFLGG
jgi:hypothetical protein